MKMETVFVSCIFLAASVSAEILENSDFELPPSLWTTTSGPFFAVNGSTIPGWSFEGDVQYVTFGANLSSGHGIALGQDGKINQTFTGDEELYLLTRNASTNCSANASVAVSAANDSARFDSTFKFGKDPWEVYGFLIGSWGWADGHSMNLVIQSEQVIHVDATCWPIIAGLSLVTTASLAHSEEENLLQNGGFEFGPSFPKTSNDEGVLLDSEPSLIGSALPEWTITGTVKYINAKNFFVPQGKAAVKLVSGGSGVQTVSQLTKGSIYKLEFMVGDANDSCSGDFILGVVAGSLVQNFSVGSNGTGSASKYSVMFDGKGPSVTQIGFQSYTTRHRDDGSLCGPVIDGVVLGTSGVHKLCLPHCFPPCTHDDYDAIV